MKHSPEIIVQLVILLNLLFYLNQKRLQREINQLKSKLSEFLVNEPQKKSEVSQEQEKAAPQTKIDFAKRMRSSGKVWQPSIQQQQKALIENMVNDDVSDEDEVAKPKKKKATAAKSTRKKSVKKDKESDK